MGIDFLIIGGGIAGASAGYALAEHGNVTVLEMEDQPGYHSTGRSAAQYVELYGNRIVRALVRLSREFLASPPDGFTEHPILSPRGALFVATEAQQPHIDELLAMASAAAYPVEQLDPAGACAVVPVLRADAFHTAVFERASMDIDVHALHQGYLSELAARGGTLVVGAEVGSLTRDGGKWRAKTPAEEFTAPVVVDAAGAWADRIAELAGVESVGLTPKRRTVILFDPPKGAEIDAWPLVIDAAEEWYFKPDAGKILGSPADETPVEPQDVQAEELDVALAVDRIERATTMKVESISHRRAGLRTFAPDKTPVVGFAPGVEGFFWLAGQGGYGIETAPALARAAASLIVDGALPAAFLEEGLEAGDLGPGRLV
ncbi:MAG: FAD-binding oxidoreductase [Alphaproteobacteria bacterium]|jgi:D-arginine dehydrogenase|nr:FAD-binding oxidoreductase [Alphaproteobacteria bacterium]